MLSQRESACLHEEIGWFVLRQFSSQAAEQVCSDWLKRGMSPARLPGQAQSPWDM